MDRKTKTIIFGEEVRHKIARGVAITEKAVGTTLGSKGRNVALEKNWGPPIVLHDGVSVAREVILKDPYENMGAQLVITAAQKTNDQAGDGTTTATILTNGIVQEAMQLVSSGVNPAVIRKGIEIAVSEVIRELTTMAKPVKTYEDLISVATISSADKDMGALIATAIKKVGEHGVTTVQEGAKSTIEVEYKEGMEFDRGLLSPYFVTNQDKYEAVISSSGKDEPPYIVLVNEKLDTAKTVTILDKILKKNQSAKVLLVADDFENDVLGMLIVNKVRANKIIIPVKAPDFGDHRTNYLHDIAVVTGGHVVGGSNGIPFDQYTEDMNGRAEKIIVTRDQTIIIGGKGKEEEIKARIATIDNLFAEARSDGERDKLEGRKAKLVGGVAVISVGAPSEAEMREKKERVYDAVNAVKAAITEGIVPGGGISLIHARKVLQKFRDAKDVGKAWSGIEIVYHALSYPIRKLIDNCGTIDAGYVIGKVEESKSKTVGYNVDTETFEDFMETGIIDPLKVIKSALINAASIATMLITTDAMVAFEREDKPKTLQDIEGIGGFND